MTTDKFGLRTIVELTVKVSTLSVESTSSLCKNNFIVLVSIISQTVEKKALSSFSERNEVVYIKSFSVSCLTTAKSFFPRNEQLTVLPIGINCKFFVARSRYTKKLSVEKTFLDVNTLHRLKLAQIVAGNLILTSNFQP